MSVRTVPGDPSLTVDQSVHVKRALDDAFRLFVDDITKWWPLHTGQFSYGGERANQIFLEANVGGRFFERFTDGEEFVVGHVTGCDRPNRIVFTWTDGQGGDTEVEVTFSQEADGTRVAVQHRALEQMGDMGPGFDQGWLDVLGYYVRAAESGQ